MAAGVLQTSWRGLKGLNPVLQEAVADRFDLQIEDAQHFSKVLLGYYHGLEKRRDANEKYMLDTFNKTFNKTAYSRSSQRWPR